ncbi:MAG: hypothetical protein NTZ32_11520 [Planctomycetales bacterium]|nr:hypothetical protein [Planctomycetales bacterium]
MNLRELQKQFIERVEAASGKPVILQSDPTFAGHATIKIASKAQPAHLLLYKPEQEEVLPYLVAHECEFALRTIQADPSAQFNLVSKPNMLQEVLELMQRHHQGKDDIPSHAVPELAKRFGNGLGLQLRSMPITMRIDKQLHDAHPELSELQHKSIDRQLQENMGALSPRAKVISPDAIIRPNASMNAAFAKFFAGLWNAPIVFAPYVAAGYGEAASALIAYHELIPTGSDHDRQLVDAWAKYTGLDRWFETESR